MVRIASVFAVIWCLLFATVLSDSASRFVIKTLLNVVIIILLYLKKRIVSFTVIHLCTCVCDPPPNMPCMSYHNIFQPSLPSVLVQMGCNSGFHQLLSPIMLRPR